MNNSEYKYSMTHLSVYICTKGLLSAGNMELIGRCIAGISCSFYVICYKLDSTLNIIVKIISNW